MHRQQARYHVLEIVPPLFVGVVIDVDFYLIREVIVKNFALLVAGGLHFDDLRSRHILNRD